MSSVSSVKELLIHDMKILFHVLVLNYKFCFLRFILCVLVFVLLLHICLCIMCVLGASGGQKRASEPQELAERLNVGAENQNRVFWKNC